MRRSALLLSLPYVMGIVLLVLVPAGAAVVLAFTQFSALGSPTFVGLSNFGDLARDEAFLRSLGNSAVYVLVAVPLRIGAALAAALLLHRRRRSLDAARAAVYLPSVMPDVAYGLLWLWILNPLFGPLAALGGAGGFHALTEPWPARVAIAVMAAFQIGEAFVVALAARRFVPQVFYEGAELERASPLFVLRRITLPQMAPILALLTARDVIVSLQASFVPALIVTGGGPRYATTYVPLLAYRTAFRYLRLGEAAAIAVVMFVFTAGVVWMQYKLAKRWRLI